MNIDLHEPVLPYVRRDVVRLRPAQRVAEAHESIRQGSSTGDVQYLYVVDADSRLVGVVPTRALLMASPDALVGDIMQEDVVAIPEWATVLVAAEYFVSKRFLAFPVVSAGGELVGQVDVSVFTDEVISLAKRSFDDIFQIIGIHATAGRTAWSGFRDRFPWLLCNVAAGILCALVAGRYEALLEAVVVLALFIPVVLTLAESVSIQSVTLTLQGLHSGGARWPLVARALRREVATAALLGFGCGSIVGAVAWAWKGTAMLGAIITGAITLSMMTAALLGMALPTALHALRRDPQIAAGPIVLATTDIATLLIYLNLAGWLAG